MCLWAERKARQIFFDAAIKRRGIIASATAYRGLYLILWGLERDRFSRSICASRYWGRGVVHCVNDEPLQLPLAAIVWSIASAHEPPFKAMRRQRDGAMDARHMTCS